ncbi:hypothetical protein AALK14_01045 [Butyricimonas hominis]|uniref:hypothetical protein n=1 Tax=Butyricimonas TaxID=574697 RepID=UPI0026DD8EF5|nr:hypothetical protein [uncultured Butyricimonas sp.]
MKKFILLLGICFCVVGIITAKAENTDMNKENFHSFINEQQDSVKMPDVENDVFVILTSDSIATSEGIYRYENTVDTTGVISSLILYEVESKSKGISFCFSHYQLKQGHADEQMKIIFRDDMKIVTLSRKFLSQIKPIDLDEKFPRMRQEDEKEFLDKYSKKRIWIIDRRYMTDTLVTLVPMSIARVSVFY